MTSTLVLLVAAWAVTVPAVLALARLLGRMSTPAPAPAHEAAAPSAHADNVVALVPRPQNGLVPAPAIELRQAS